MGKCIFICDSDKLSWNLKDDDLKRQEQIDSLNKLLESYRIIYMQGLTGIGKTTVLKQMTQEASFDSLIYIWKAKDDKPEILKERLCEMEQVNDLENPYIIWEDIHVLKNPQSVELLKNFVEQMPKQVKFIVTGQEELFEAFDSFVWQRELFEYNGRQLFFVRDDIRKLFAKAGVQLTFSQVTELYQVTEGWPGAVGYLLTLLKTKYQGCYIREIVEDQKFLNYIEKNIWRAMSSKEQELCKISSCFHLFLPEMMEEIFGMHCLREEMVNLEQKQIIHGTWGNMKFQVTSLLQLYIYHEYSEELKVIKNQSKQVGQWFEKNQEIQKAFLCYKESREQGLLLSFMKRQYRMILFQIEEQELQMVFQECPSFEQEYEILYLKAASRYVNHKFQEALAIEERLKKRYKIEKEPRIKKNIGEILVNLWYVNSNLSFYQWLDCSEEVVREIGPVELFSLQGYEPHCYYGLRDFTEVLKAGKREKNCIQKRWNTLLMESQHIYWDMALKEFQEEMNDEIDIASLQEWRTYLLQQNVAMFRQMYFGLLNEYQIMKGKSEGISEQIFELEKELEEEKSSIFLRHLKGQKAFYGSFYNEKYNLIEWKRTTEFSTMRTITMENSFDQRMQAKAYIVMGQYEKASFLLDLLTAFYKKGKSYRLLSECMFLQAYTYERLGEKTRAFRTVIESFSVSYGAYFIKPYLYYGDIGLGLIESYIDFMKDHNDINEKKPYIGIQAENSSFSGYLKRLRKAVKKTQIQNIFQQEKKEAKEDLLTATEITVLKYIIDGLTNQEIGEKMEIKLTTVKTHVSSIYKKMNVKNRTQAIAMAREEKNV